MKPPSYRSPACCWLVAAAAFAASHALLLGNPGYLSHDELQWGARAQEGASLATLRWAGWTDVAAFQWRPLTFNLWLLLARVAFDEPMLMHALWLACGFGVTALLYATLRRADVAPRVATAAAAAFALSPFATYVHGWTATLAEMLWVALALALAWCVLGCRRDAMRAPALAALAATSLALLAKEAALAIAPLLALAWLLSRREPRWLAATLGAALPTLLYLALRLPMLLFGPRPDGAYAWSPEAIVPRWIELQLYPFVVTAFELSGVANASSARAALATAVALALPACVARAGWRHALGFVLGGAFAIGPALLLHQGYPQYGYAYAGLACCCVALAWPRMHGAARAAVAFALLLSTWHGVNVQREMRRVGDLQARFTPALDAARRQRAEDAGVRLYVRVASDRDAYRRLAVTLDDRDPAPAVELVDAEPQADYAVRDDGGLEPLAR